MLPKIDVHDIILIGGEPTVYSRLPDVLSKAKENGIEVGIVTNGVALKNKTYLQKLIDCGASHFGISLKGFDRQSFIDTTGQDQYENVLCAISNLSSSGIPFSVSFVLTKENIPHIYKGVSDAVQAGARRVRLSFCYDFEACRTDVRAVENPFALASLFQEHYPTINDACHGNLGLFQSLPFCVFDPQFVELLDSRNQLTSVCQVLQKNGLVIDTDLSIIPCNAMYDFKIGQFGQQFFDSESFHNYWTSEPVEGFYNKLRALPDEACVTCKSCSNCGGGCVSNWFNYSFEELMRMKGHNGN